MESNNRGARKHKAVSSQHSNATTNQHNENGSIVDTARDLTNSRIDFKKRDKPSSQAMENTVYSTAVGDYDYLNDKELRQLFHTSELEAFKGVFDLYDIDGD